MKGTPVWTLSGISGFFPFIYSSTCATVSFLGPGMFSLLFSNDFGPAVRQAVGVRME